MYDELVKMLRVCGDSNNSCGNCPVRENDGSCPHGDWEFAAEKYMLQAADAVEELNKRIDFLMNCIYEAEDALDRGADNEWARASLEKAERWADDVQV